MKSLKLNQIEKDAMSKKEQLCLKGGKPACGCRCSGDATLDNAEANIEAGNPYTEGDNFILQQPVVVTP